MRKKLATVTLLVLTCASFGFFLCHSSIIKDEEEFARYLLIREGGMYTLVGSKPITWFYIENNQLGSDENTKKNHPIQYVLPKEIEATEDDSFNSKTAFVLWKKWQKRHKRGNQQYELVVVEHEDGDNIYFVNKSLVRETLLKHYPLFVKQVGTDFDIDQVLSHIGERQSFFWRKIFCIDHPNHISAGLFFGYGLENAIGFENLQKNHQQENPIFSTSLVELLKARWKKEVSLKELPLPMFRAFSATDHQVELYKKERDNIRKEYEKASLRDLLVLAFQ